MKTFQRYLSSINKGSIVEFLDLPAAVPGGGGVLDISLGGEVRRGPSYPDPV